MSRDKVLPITALVLTVVRGLPVIFDAWEYIAGARA